jgi:hypothetical protein
MKVSIAKAMFFLLLLLGAAILSFPVNFSYRLTAIQSITIFGGHFTWFMLVYYLFLAVLFILVFYIEDVKNYAPFFFFLVASFTLVNTGFTLLKANFPLPIQDGIFFRNLVISILQSHHLGGSVASNPYSTIWPAEQLLTSVLVRVTSLGLTSSFVLVILSVLILTVASLFLIFSLVTSSYRIATIGGIIIMAGSVIGTMYSYHSDYFGLATFMLALSLLLSFHSSHVKKNATLSALILLMIAMSLSSFEAIVMTVLILFCTFLVTRGFKYSYLVPLSGILGSFPFIFSTYFVSFIEGEVTYLTNTVRLFTDWFTIYHSYVVGPTLPFWANLLTISWEVVFVLPFLIFAMCFLYGIFIRRRRGKLISSSTSAYLMAYFLSLCMFALASATGGGLVIRLFFFLPVFSTMLLITNSRFARYLIVVCILIILISFPTFVDYNRNISTYAYESTDIAGNQFLAKLTPGFQIFQLSEYTNPQVSTTVIGLEGEYGNMLVLGSLREGVASALASFNSGAIPSIFVVSQRSILSTWIYYGEAALNIWSTTSRNLLNRSLVYDNGNELFFYN